MKEYDYSGRFQEIEIRWGEPASIDDKDKKILKMLSKNARIPVSKIAKAINLSRDAVKYRIDKMISNDVIQGFEVVINPPKIGFPMFNCVTLALWNLKPQREEDFKEFIKKHPFVIWASRTMGNWDAFLLILSKDPNHLNKTIGEMRDKFSDIIKEVDIASVIHEFKFTQFPGKFE